MPASDWTRMGIASAVAVIAISFLAVDASVDVNSAGIAKRLEATLASITHVTAGERQLAFAVEAWAHESELTRRSAADPSCVPARQHRPQPVSVIRHQQSPPLSVQRPAVDPVQDEAG
ncbi:hypothetical protein [Bradyrhizobium sp. RDM4]|uniref:hypothetical protein n=1 Tax=Bradyrhizobium sp. RDM4 TaxID=3378765 RepID=UPI0038FBF767